MFSFFKKKYRATPADFSGIQTDMHSHLLPGIDDGAPDAATAVLLKKGLEDLGYRQFIATPHIMWDLYKNTPATIAAGLQLLQQEDHASNIRYAAEYFMDEHFNEMVENKTPLLAINDRQVLVEFSFVAPPLDLKEMLFRLLLEGYEPIIAHPERYAYFTGNRSVFDDLKNIGCLLQVNLLSLTGYYGKLPQELATYLLSRNYIDFAGTDLHHQKHLEVLRQSRQLEGFIKKMLDSGTLKNASLTI